ncbi:hypothetical protein [Mesorhizobium sp. IMUNJ 23232]|uniref:hypothetical protein n=1 Tax=Mesorhizobium sp. IMUNJ 23232 TaxID=3376064 RepID=UPI0037AE01F9
MAGSDLPPGAKAISGAFVQLIPDIVLFTPNIILFQYNPEKISRGLTPWNPFEQSSSPRGAAAPDVAPTPPDEKISFELHLDATDFAQQSNPINRLTGVASRIAAIRKLTKASQGMLGDLVQSVANLAGADTAQAKRPSIPITFLIFGPGLMLPVRLTSLSIEETMFTEALYPIHAKASVEMQVIRPDMFKCKEDLISDLAIAAYNLNQIQEDALAIANLANGAFDIMGMLQG